MATDAVKALAQRSIDGDREALSALCEQIMEKVFLNAMYLLKDKHDADDVTQEILLRVVRNIGELKDAGSFGFWLGSITINEVRRYSKKKSMYSELIDREDQAELIEDTDSEFLPQIAVDNKEYRHEIMNIILELPERQREAVILHYFDDMSVVDTAAIMEVTQPAVSRYLKLARNRIASGFDRLYGMRESGAVAGAGAGTTAGTPAGAGVAVGAVMLPASSIIPQIISASGAESGMFTKSDQALLLKKCNEQIAQRADSASKATKSGTGATATTGIFAAIGIALLVVTGIFLFNITGSADQTGDQSGIITAGAVQHDAEYDADVAFTGGDPDYPFVDPTQAVAQPPAGSAFTADSWEITSADSDAVIISGKGSRVNSGFNSLESGNYRLTYILSDQQGNHYKLSRTFIIS